MLKNGIRLMFSLIQLSKFIDCISKPPHSYLELGSNDT
jgi:hypothetical protein